VRDDGPRWDDRYRATTRAEPRRPEAIQRWPDLDTRLPTTGRFLDIASGPGAVALWAAARGLDVTALDVSTVAIELLRAGAAALGYAARIETRIVDLDDGLPADLVDLDLIVCQRFRDPALTTAMLERLRVGGYVVVTVLSAVGTDHPGEFHAPAEALWNEFSDDERCEVVHHHEGDGIAHIVARRC
jgi:SAM-dependent methyltransferase